MDSILAGPRPCASPKWDGPQGQRRYETQVSNDFADPADHRQVGEAHSLTVIPRNLARAGAIYASWASVIIAPRNES